MDPEPLSQDQLDNILQKLQSPAFYVKTAAINELRTVKSSSTEIVDALISALNNETDNVIKRQIKEVLRLPAHEAVIKQQHPELAQKAADKINAERAVLEKKRSRARLLALPAKILALLAGALVIWSITSLTQIEATIYTNYQMQGTAAEEWTTNFPWVAPSWIFWVVAILAGMTALIWGKTRGQWWLGGGLLCAVLLWFGIGKAQQDLEYAASVGAIRTWTATSPIFGIYATVEQSIQEMKISIGFYVAMASLIILAACGIWDILQKRKAKTGLEVQINEIDEIIAALEGK